MRVLKLHILILLLSVTFIDSARAEGNITDPLNVTKILSERAEQEYRNQDSMKFPSFEKTTVYTHNKNFYIELRSEPLNPMYDSIATKPKLQFVFAPSSITHLQFNFQHNKLMLRKRFYF